MSVSKRIYVASSWRNPIQQSVVDRLRIEGHDVYDFRHPREGDDGFHWSEIDPNWKSWSAEQFRNSLDHRIAAEGFANDFNAMLWSDICVLVLPCGRSAHLEAGYFAGTGKEVYVLLDDHQEPELMYRITTKLCLSLDELVQTLRKR